MALLICAPDRSNQTLVSDLQARLPDVDIRLWPEIGQAEDITFAVLWKHPPNLIGQLPKLKAVTSLGAGIEHLIKDPELTGEIPVGRLAGPKLAENMALWLVGRVISDWLDFHGYHKHQSEGQWQPTAPAPKPSVGILGMGQMGRCTANHFKDLGFKVSGYSLSGQGPDGITMHRGKPGLTDLAGWADYLICLLPLTSQTKHILNAELMSQMKPGSVLINVGRGDHLNEPDLLTSLSEHRPVRAILDVFSTEPLPSDHAFWSHPQITISPHCASLTDPQEAADLIARSYQNVMSGKAPLGLVDINLGY